MAGIQKKDNPKIKKEKSGNGKKGETGLKELLRSAGYLDNRLERYFIRNLKRKGSAFLSYISTSLKIGAAIGFLFAIFFTAAIVYFNPALLRNIKDSFLLTVYLWLIFAVVFSVFALLIGIIISRVQSYFRGGAGKMNASLISAIIIGVAIFSYLSVWWIKASMAAGLSRTGMRDLIALAFIFALSLFLSRLVFLAGIALLRKNEANLPFGKTVRFRRKHLIGAAFAAILFFSLLFFLISAKIIQPEIRVSSNYTIVYPRYRVILVAIDGIDHIIRDKLIERGKLTFFKKLLNSGLTGTLKNDHGFVPPVYWTTVATGMNPAEHGIANMNARRFAGVATPFQESLGEPVLGSALMALIPSSGSDSRVPITANLRRTKTFWNILNDKTLPVGIVNWWVTWPCEQVNGFEVSERLIYKLDKMEKLEKDIYPEDMLDKSVINYNESARIFSRIFSERFPSTLMDSIGKEAAKSLKDAAWIDFFYSSLYSVLCKKYEVKLAGLYLPGLDIVQSKMLADNTYKNLDDLKNRLEAVENYYIFLDGLLAQSLGSLTENDYLLLLATQGREVRLIEKNGRNSNGFYTIIGPGVAVGVKAPAMTPLDITPTLLYLFGFPKSTEFKGKPVTGLFKETLRSRLNSAVVETFGDRAAGTLESEDSNFSREMLEQLRNLGYIN
jgi:hypothetical protein